MQVWFVLMVLWGLLGLSGCASRTPQTDAILQMPGLPRQAEVEDVPFIKQTEFYCGPASLLMVLQWGGLRATLDQVATQVYTPGMKGSLQTDMVTAARRHGFIAIPIEGYPALLQEIAAGHPVVVFQNLGLSWIPRWHYAVAYGYDLDQQKLILHSGPSASIREDLGEFERSWKLADSWGLIVLPPGRWARSQAELPHLKAAMALEQLGQSEAAETAYQTIVKQWPASLAARIGLANLAMAKMKYAQAIDQLRLATKSHPTSAIAWHNLALALLKQGAHQEANASATQALLWVSGQDRARYEVNLREALVQLN